MVLGDHVEPHQGDVESLATELDRVWQRGVDYVDDTGGRMLRCDLPILEQLIATSPWGNQPRPAALRHLLTEASNRAARPEALQRLFDLEPHANHLPRNEASANALGTFGSARALSTKRKMLRQDFARTIITVSGHWRQIVPRADEVRIPSQAVPMANRRLGNLSRILQRDMDVAARTNQEMVTLSGGGHVARTIEPAIIEMLLHQGRDVIVNAEPGYGKSTLLWSLARTLSDHDTVLPVLISAAWLLADGDQAPLLSETAMIEELTAMTADHRVVVLLDTADILLHSESTRMRTLILLSQLSDNGIRWCAASRPLEAEVL